MLFLFLLHDGINHGDGCDVDDVAYRGFPVGEVDRLVQTHLDRADNFTVVAHHLDKLVGLVGTGEVGEHEGVDLLAIELVEREFLVAQLAVEGKFYLHLTIYIPLGV